MPTQPNPTRPLLEVAVSFLGALLVLPVAFKAVAGTVRGLLRLSIVRRLIGEAVIVGLTTLLTRDDVLDAIFGKKKQIGASRPEAQQPLGAQETKGTN